MHEGGVTRSWLVRSLDSCRREAGSGGIQSVTPPADLGLTHVVPAFGTRTPRLVLFATIKTSSARLKALDGTGSHDRDVRDLRRQSSPGSSAIVCGPAL